MEMVENLYKHSKVYGNNMKMVGNLLKLYGNYMETIWKLYGKDVERMWKQYGNEMEMEFSFCYRILLKLVPLKTLLLIIKITKRITRFQYN